MFDLEGQSESMTKPYFKQLGKEDFLWFLDDVVEAARLSRFFKEEALLNVIGTRINNIDALLASNENAYWDEVERAGRRELTNMFKQLCKSQQGPRLQMGKMYAYEIGDRILHDRELCYFIAQTIMDIGFDGETNEGLKYNGLNVRGGRHESKRSCAPEIAESALHVVSTLCRNCTKKGTSTICSPWPLAAATIWSTSSCCARTVTAESSIEPRRRPVLFRNTFVVPRRRGASPCQTARIGSTWFLPAVGGYYRLRDSLDRLVA